MAGPAIPVQSGASGAIPVYLAGGGNLTIGTVDIDQTTPGATNGVVTNAGSVTSLIGSTVGTQTTVNGSATAVTLLATNALRKGGTVSNNSTAILYLILSATTPTTSIFTVAMVGNSSGIAYYEIPFGYTGIVQGIWASSTGSASIVEMT